MGPSYVKLASTKGFGAVVSGTGARFTKGSDEGGVVRGSGRDLSVEPGGGALVLNGAFSEMLSTLSRRSLPRGGFSSVPHGGQNGAAEQHFRGLGLRDGDRRRFFGGGVL